MAVTEIYVDHSGGSDPGPEPGSGGDGSSGNPVQTLSAAFTLAATAGTSANVRINVKNTSSSSKMTSLGSLPTGHSISSQIVIAPYSSSAGDTENLLYLDAGGSDDVLDNDTVDAIVWNRCHFSNTSTDSGSFMNLDNNLLFYKCTFDNCTFTGDNSIGAYFCTWENMVASGNACFASGSSSVVYGCNISGSGESTLPYLIQSLWIMNSVVYWNGTVDLMWKSLSAAGGCLQNAFVYSDASHSSGDGNGVQIDDQVLCQFNYFENCAVAIEDENNSEVVINGPNAFYGNTTKRFTVDSNMLDITKPITAADYDLSASGYPNASSNNWTMSDDLRNERTNQYTPLTATSTAIEAYFGAFLKTADGSGGTTGKQGLHGIETGSV